MENLTEIKNKIKNLNRKLYSLEYSTNIPNVKSKINNVHKEMDLLEDLYERRNNEIIERILNWNK